MNEIRAVYIGNFALRGENQIHGMKSYARFFNELAEERKNGIAVFGGYLVPGDTGFEFLNEAKLSDKINFTLARGNTPTTGLLKFVWNNIFIFARLTGFSLKKGDYFVFLPSPIGVWSVLVATLFKRNRSLGIYIGGYYKREQAFERRKGFLKKRIKRLGASIVERLLLRAIRKADYIITPSYELYESLKSTEKVFLTPPLMNVEEKDIHLSFSKEEGNFITYCGELRHAKGVVDLLRAFVQLIKEAKINDYKLKIIGSGQAFEELNAIAQNEGVVDKVIFCGQIKGREELKKHIGTSSIFVLPSYSEGFPRVAYECFTLGVACILTPVGGIPFFVKDNEHCLLTQPGDIEGLAAKIETLIKDKTLQARLAGNAKKLMIESVFPRVKADVSLKNVVVNKIDQVHSS